jgi:hypothetical protein
MSTNNRDLAIHLINSHRRHKLSELTRAALNGASIFAGGFLLFLGTQIDQSPWWTFLGAGQLAWGVVAFRKQRKEIHVAYDEILRKATDPKAVITVTEIPHE